jgi:hypothetical protein
MLSIAWTFAGAIAGLLLCAVFAPPSRGNSQLPTPNTKKVFHTPSGCVKFKTHEVECSRDSTSLNFVASEHKGWF